MYTYVTQEMTAMSHRGMKESKAGVYVKHHVCQWDPMAAEVSP